MKNKLLIVFVIMILAILPCSVNAEFPNCEYGYDDTNKFEGKWTKVVTINFEPETGEIADVTFEPEFYSGLSEIDQGAFRASPAVMNLMNSDFSSGISLNQKANSKTVYTYKSSGQSLPWYFTLLANFDATHLSCPDEFLVTVMADYCSAYDCASWIKAKNTYTYQGKDSDLYSLMQCTGFYFTDSPDANFTEFKTVGELNIEGSEFDVDLYSFNFDVYVLSTESTYNTNKENGTTGTFTYCGFYKDFQNELTQIINKNGGTCNGKYSFSETYDQIINRCNNFRASHQYADAEDDTDKVANAVKQCMKNCSGIRDYVNDRCAFTSTDTCNSLGGKVMNWIFRVIKIIRYAVPAILIILSILDWIKAIASESDDEMKKVTTRFMKRLIASALIFLIPFVLDFILRMFSIPGLNADNPFCAN